MPLYDYRCDACGDFEAWRRLADLETPMACPTCESSVRRLFVPPNINLNSGSFLGADRSAEVPRLVKRRVAEPTQPRIQNSTCSRPWMVGHAPERM